MVARAKSNPIPAGKGMRRLVNAARAKRYAEAEAKREKLRQDPIAMAREIRRYVALDHEKLDTLQLSLDQLWIEMDRDTLCDNGRQRIATAVAAGELSFQGDDRDVVSMLDHVWRPAAQLRQGVEIAPVDSYCRGLTTYEILWERLESGPYAGLDVVSRLRRLEQPSIQIEEDQWGRVSGIQIKRPTPGARAPEPKSGPWLLAGYGYQQWQYYTVRPDSPDWQSYLFLTTPWDATRARGEGAYVKAWPHYYFGLHLLQWLRGLTERHGTPAVAAIPTGIAATITGTTYPATRDEVFAALEEIQTHFRGLLPPGYDIKAIDVGAEGLAAMLQQIAAFNRSMVDLSITGEQVTSGAEASLGTRGANEMVANTFLRVVAQSQLRAVSLIDRIDEMILRVNGITAEVPRARLESVDPEAQRQKREAIGLGIDKGVILPTEPWVRQEYGAKPLDEETLSGAIETRDRLAATAMAQQPVTGPGFDAPAYDLILVRLAEGEIGPRQATIALRQILADATPEELAEIVAEAATRRVRVPVDVPDTASTREAARAATPAPATPAPEATAVAASALNGAQIASLKEIIVSVTVKELPPAAAVLLVEAAFPSVSTAAEMVRAAAAWTPPVPVVPVPAAPAGAVRQGAQPMAERVRLALGSLTERLAAGGYDASRPAPVGETLTRLYGDDRLGQTHRAEITAWIARDLPGCQTAAERRALGERIADHYGEKARGST